MQGVEAGHLRQRKRDVKPQESETWVSLLLQQHGVLVVDALKRQTMMARSEGGDG